VAEVAQIGRPQVWPAYCAIRGRFEPSRRPRPKKPKKPAGLSRRTSYAVTLAGLGGFRDCHENTELRLTKFRGPAGVSRRTWERPSSVYETVFLSRRNRRETEGPVSCPQHERKCHGRRFDSICYLHTWDWRRCPSGRAGKCEGDCCPRSAVRIGRTARERPSPPSRWSPK
jgi:hypothetical protein